MKKKIMNILICMLLIVATFVFAPSETLVKADLGGGGEGSGEIGLNYTYLWEQINLISNVIYDAYNDTDIRKGRYIGSKGGIYAADIIIEERMNDLGLENVDMDQLGYLGLSYPRYSSMIDVVQYNLTVNNATDSYEFNNNIPQSEFFPTASSVLKIGTNFTYNSAFENCKIIHDNFRTKVPEEFFNSLYTITTYYTEVSVENKILFGNITYIAPEETCPSEEEQQGMIYLLEDVPQSQDIIDNLSIAEGCVLVDNLIISDLSLDHLENNNIITQKITQSSGQDLKEILENYSKVLCENLSGNINISYDFNETCRPSSDFVVIDRIPGHAELFNDTTEYLLDMTETYGYPGPNLMSYIGCYAARSFLYSWFPKCKGIILYNSYDQYVMFPTTIKWAINVLPDINVKGNKYNIWLPTFSVNNSLGTYLNNTRSGCCGTKINGNISQVYLKQTIEDPGAEAYNVIGEINIDESPLDKYVIISNRYDGVWGQTPGDSGIGTAITLGLAKHIKDLQQDYNIDPKYNITFLFTTGEEIGFRGAQYHHDKIVKNGEQNKIDTWIGFDQLGMIQSNVPLSPQFGGKEEENNASDNKKILWAIANDTNYEGRNSNDIEFIPADKDEGCENTAWNDICDTIQFVRGGKYRRWDRWHSSGNNYTNGDSLINTDSTDVNLTYELAWNLTKYYVIDPDCWFDSVTFQQVDSPDDADYLDDSIWVNYTINSKMPHDQNMIHINLTNSSGYVDTWQNFTVNSSGKTGSVLMTVPPEGGYDSYRCRIDLYNSTGRINHVVGIDTGSNNYNDTRPEPGIDPNYLLYPYEPDVTAPTITNVEATPDIVGFGQTVTISANVTDPEPGSGLYQVIASVSIPGGMNPNYIMDHISGDMYQFEFNTTWITGQFNFSISSTDNKNNVNVSSGHSFIVSIGFVPPTPPSGAQNDDYIDVNISSFYPNQHYVFNEFNNDNALWMRMDDVNGGTVVDLSSYKNNGTAIDDASQNDTGMFGKSFYMDGVTSTPYDHISIPDSDSLNFTGNMTVSCWVRADGSPSQWDAILTKDADSNWDDGYGMWYESSSEIRFWVGDSYATQYAAKTGVTTTGWNHVVGTCDGSTIKLYVNGVSGSDGSGAPTVVSGDLEIGGGQHRLYNLKGWIDEALIFDRCLDETEIQALYNATTYQYQHNFTGLSDGTYDFTGYAVNLSGVKSQTETRTVTIDNVAPEIDDISDSPDPVGFGFNVSINADVFDDVSGVDEVKVSIAYPGPASKKGNFTMSHMGGDTYEYVFDNTWLVGQYNYSIWAVDEAGNSNTSSLYSFIVSAYANISIQTLEDFYGMGEYINITDPPSSGGDWVIDGDTVYLDDEDVYLSATPHTITQPGWVEFELLSKTHNGSIDAVWGFNTEQAQPKRAEIWRNYTHDLEGWHDEQQYLNVTLDNCISYQVLDIADYDTYVVDYGNRNNTKLWKVNYSVEDPENITTIIIAFTQKQVVNGTSIFFEYYEDVTVLYEYQSTFWDWKHLDKDYIVDNTLYEGYDKWYILEDISILEDKLYRVRCWIDIPFGGFIGTDGKYWWSIKPHNKNLSEAIDDDQFYSLDPWWSSSWNTRKQCNISNPRSGYQMKLVVDYDDNQGGNVSCEGNCQNDFGDIRFTDPSSNMLLPYWIENQTDGSQATFWVNNTGNYSSFFMYYNTTVTSVDVSDGNTTFDFFDDFLGTSLNTDVWDVTEDNAVVTVADSFVTMTATGNFVSDGTYILIKEAYYQDIDACAIECKWMVNRVYGGHVNPYIQSWYTDYQPPEHQKDHMSYVYTDTGSAPEDQHRVNSFLNNVEDVTQISTGSMSDNVWHYLTQCKDSTTPKIYNLLRDADKVTIGSATRSGDPFYDDYAPFSWRFWMYNKVTEYLKADWVFIRKWTGGTEPSWSSFGSEESKVYNQSKINNSGSTNISGCLLIQVQYYNETLGDWVVDAEPINWTSANLTVNFGEQFGLDTVFNGIVNTSDLSNGYGDYRVYAAFRDPDGDVLICDDETVLEAWYGFEVSTS